ncbi:MAG: sigma-70 family RNA polymerase sigma factor [Candidatus Hydrogenedentes bacterium]|nr:sigma-70 family RNA polymerase sigma factor [Candidatus Hydrogenedentota bacterium]
MSSNLDRSEQELIAACLAGAPGAWDQFMIQYRRVIRATAGRLCQRYRDSSTDTDDLEHHVYQKLMEDNHRRIRAWQGRAKFSTYLVQITRNLVLDYFALRKKAPDVEAYQAHLERAKDGPKLEDEEINDARRAALRKALESLPEKQALIIRLRLEGKSLCEIAAITNRPLGTVSVENSRALEKLRARMKAALADAEGSKQPS